MGLREVHGYEELHQLWVRDPCDARQLHRRQRDAKLGYTRQDVQDYVNARVVDDSEHVVLDRIMTGCGEARQAYDVQAAYGMTYTMDSVERLHAEMVTTNRIDRQMREFIDRCGANVHAVVSAQTSKLYYTKSIVVAAIHRSQIRSHHRLFSDAVLDGCVSSERLCGRLKRDGHGDLCIVARSWYKKVMSESTTWSLSRAQQRTLRDAWLQRRGSASELCRRVGGLLGSADAVLVVRRWLDDAEPHLQATHARRRAMYPGGASMRTLAMEWRMLRHMRSDGGGLIVYEACAGMEDGT